jgi:hypothetical protein
MLSDFSNISPAQTHIVKSFQDIYKYAHIFFPARGHVPEVADMNHIQSKSLSGQDEQDRQETILVTNPVNPVDPV